jgi:hypothetical protein
MSADDEEAWEKAGLFNLLVTINTFSHQSTPELLTLDPVLPSSLTLQFGRGVAPIIELDIGCNVQTSSVKVDATRGCKWLDYGSKLSLGGGNAPVTKDSLRRIAGKKYWIPNRS